MPPQVVSPRSLGATRHPSDERTQDPAGSSHSSAKNAASDDMGGMSPLPVATHWRFFIRKAFRFSDRLVRLVEDKLQESLSASKPTHPT